MKVSKRIRLYRPVAESSVPTLEAFGGAVAEQFPRYDFTPREELNATIIESTESECKPENGKVRFLRNALYPHSAHCAESLTLPVTRVEFFGNHLGYRSLALVLDDFDGILANERSHYLGHINRLNAKTIQPHVSVLDVDFNHSTRDVLEWAESISPSSVTLDRLETFPKVHFDPIRPPAKPIGAVHFKSSLEGIPVRNITEKPPVPEGLLRALRNAE